MSWIVMFMPRRQISRILGYFLHKKWPNALRFFLIRSFAKLYKINVSEAELPIESYESIGDFFVRKLKPTARPLGSAPILHPADSVITQASELKGGQLIQAKGFYYSVEDFLVGLSGQDYQGGAFATYYLCPTDYHRVHSPVSGRIGRVIGVPGDLWPVNNWSTTTIKNLFVKNERVIVEVLTDLGPLAFVMVGATNVGQMSLTFWPEFRTNDAQFDELGSRQITIKDFEGKIKIEKGQELGAFHMGSTVVLCLSQNLAQKNNWLMNLAVGKQVHVRADFNKFIKKLN